jgi:hypothetical protein
MEEYYLVGAGIVGAVCFYLGRRSRNREVETLRRNAPTYQDLLSASGEGLKAGIKLMTQRGTSVEETD